MPPETNGRAIDAAPVTVSPDVQSGCRSVGSARSRGETAKAVTPGRHRLHPVDDPTPERYRMPFEIWAADIATSSRFLSLTEVGDPKRPNVEAGSDHPGKHVFPEKLEHPRPW
jgi:hypothetical protein